MAGVGAEEKNQTNQNFRLCLAPSAKMAESQVEFGKQLTLFKLM